MSTKSQLMAAEKGPLFQWEHFFRECMRLCSYTDVNYLNLKGAVVLKGQPNFLQSWKCHRKPGSILCPLVIYCILVTASLKAKNKCFKKWTILACEDIIMTKPETSYLKSQNIQLFEEKL